MKSKVDSKALRVERVQVLCSAYELQALNALLYVKNLELSKAISMGEMIRRLCIAEFFKYEKECVAHLERS